MEVRVPAAGLCDKAEDAEGLPVEGLTSAAAGGGYWDLKAGGATTDDEGTADEAAVLFEFGRGSEDHARRQVVVVRNLLVSRRAAA
jgi:hypothetical protein